MSAVLQRSLSVKARVQFRECFSLDEGKRSRSLITLCILTLWGSALPTGPRGWEAGRTMDRASAFFDLAPVPPQPVLSRQFEKSGSR